MDSSNTINNRHSSPPPMSDSLRPPTQRKRSNSVPIMEALGCSTPEARLILAEGRAAVSHRKESARRRGRRDRDQDDLPNYNPRDHMQYLDSQTYHTSHEERQDSMCATDRTVFRHSRYPSNATDSSVSTVTATHDSPGETHGNPHIAIKSPVGDYSANLARFIRAQLSSIPTYTSVQLPLSPSSCPDLSYTNEATPRSPTKIMHRSIEPPRIINIPAVRPPMRSAFSEWSSTDEDDNDEDSDDELPHIPTSQPTMATPASKPSYTPSLLHYYENTKDSSFLFTDTPLDEDPSQGFSFPATTSARPARSPAPVPSSSPPPPMPPLPAMYGPPSLATSSAPSISTVSTGSYFDSSLNPTMRDRVIAAVTPPANPTRGKSLTSSPFEGKALVNMHNALVESQHRVNIDGMSFDMINEYSNMSAGGRNGQSGMQRVQTPC
ncbi:unnamed protein product [Periconia digitata]|uniref:Uncharacterized protein n=1 Tax=Periconia digitata TaxID=1303443 RepID=A0A9W4URX0_9PLEO|nr:unnamed protein product [Periconia digitata]